MRGDPSIPPATRDRIRALAAQRGYKPDPAVAGLMARIRSGRVSKTGDCIALLVDSPNRAAWFDHDIFRLQYEGMRRSAQDLGFRVEAFYLRSPGMNPARLDRVLRNRGSRGLVLAGPKRGAVDLSALSWESYACATISCSWDSPAVDRV